MAQRPIVNTPKTAKEVIEENTGIKRKQFASTSRQPATASGNNGIKAIIWILSIVAFIILSLTFLIKLGEESQREAEVFFHGHRKEILTTLNQFRKEKEIEKAAAYYYRFRHIGDSELQRLIDENETKLKELKILKEREGIARIEAEEKSKEARDHKIQDMENLKVVISRVQLEGFQWYLGGFDTVAFADFKIRNDNSFDIKDIEITCAYSAPSGTLIDVSSKTVYDIVKSGKKRSFKEFNMGFVVSQVTNAKCTVTAAIPIR